MGLADEAKSKTVHDILVKQYHELRIRDVAIDTRLKVEGKEINYANRATQLAEQSKSLHDQFLAALATNLSPEQVEKIKDLMTYNKLKVTYDAYVAIITGLTDAEKAKIMDLLKTARDEAIDGGSAPENPRFFRNTKTKSTVSWTPTATIPARR